MNTEENKYTLKKPIILLSGETLSELAFNWESLSFADLATAKKIKSMIVKSEVSVNFSPKTDIDLRIGLAWVAAMRSNSKILLEDILKLSVVDAFEISDLALEDYLI